MLHSHSKFDKKNDGFFQRIHVDGSNDTVDIIWGGEDLKMNARLNVEERLKDIFLLSKKIVILSIESVEKTEASCVTSSI
jgi:hypothetical protein